MKRKPYDLECEQVIFPVNPDEFKSFFEVIIYMVLYTTGSLYMYIYLLLLEYIHGLALYSDSQIVKDERREEQEEVKLRNTRFYLYLRVGITCK